MAPSSRRSRGLVLLYLGAIVVANLAVARWGQAALPFTAFLLIPFDLVTRDVLHDRWQGPRLWPRMAALVAGGSLLTALLNAGAGRVALASFAAFAVGGTADALVYHAARRRSRLARINLSNAAGAVLDSLVFPAIAFATVSPALSAAQAGMKFAGGVVWGLLAVRVLFRPEVRYGLAPSRGYKAGHLVELTPAQLEALRTRGERPFPPPLSFDSQGRPYVRRDCGTPEE